MLSFAAWKDWARPLLLERVETPHWLEMGAPPAPSSTAPVGALSLPAELVQLLQTIRCHRTPGRYEFMYRLAWRALYQNRRLLEDEADPDVRQARHMEKAIRRDCHKMHAFVRFQETPGEDGELHYLSWFEPDHEILERGAKFFTKRFPNMQWTIATPDGTAVWNRDTLNILDAPQVKPSTPADEHAELWRLYYRSICNVSRINPRAMQREMPQKYWKNLPEANDIGILIRDGADRFAHEAREVIAETRTPKAVERALGALPADSSLDQCRRCELWKNATQAVPGQGAKHAHLMLVGEQPGDEEDLKGQPFVGPAGKVLDDCLEAAGVDRAQVYITNAVKHFKWEPRGKRRLHKKPDLREIGACSVWLEQEILAEKPRVIVALGATALRSIMGRTLAIAASRGAALAHPSSGTRVIATYHPSAVLRAEGPHQEEIRSALIEDLQRARTDVQAH